MQDTKISFVCDEFSRNIFGRTPIHEISKINIHI